MTKTKVELERYDYAIASGKVVTVRVDEPKCVDLTLPNTFAARLLGQLMKARAADPDEVDEYAEILVDVPIKIAISRLQMEQLIEKLVAEVE